MILVCPLCQTRFLIPASLFVSGPRRVRCARCLHSWLAETPKEIDVVAAPDFHAILTSEVGGGPPPIPEGSNLPALTSQAMPVWMRRVMVGCLVGALVLLVGGLILGRKNVMAQWPVTKSIYEAVGLRIYHLGEGLVLSGVRSEMRYEDGIMRLVVEGQIDNTTDKRQKIPNIAVSAIGSDGSTAQSWQIDAPAMILDAHQTMPFQSAINAPKTTVVNVTLNFLEPAHE